MAQTFRSLSSLLIVLACCFLNGATAEEREGKQILLPAAANLPVYYYASGRPVFVNAGETPTDDYGTDAVGRTFFRIFGCPTCPTCPGPCPTCPTCAVCPATPAIPAKAITLAPLAAECLTAAGILDVGVAISACSSVSAAPRGSIDVLLAAGQSVVIGIAAVTPNTQIRLTCTTITAAVAKTQRGALVVNTPVTAFEFLQILVGGAAGNRVQCTWESF